MGGVAHRTHRVTGLVCAEGTTHTKPAPHAVVNNQGRFRNRDERPDQRQADGGGRAR